MQKHLKTTGAIKVRNISSTNTDLFYKLCRFLFKKRFKKINQYILGVVKRNPLFFHSISCKNNGFFFTTPNIIHYNLIGISRYSLQRLTTMINNDSLNY